MNARRGMVPDDLYRMTFVEDPQIAPDGERIAFVCTRLDRDSDDYRSSIWQIASEGGAAKRLTFGEARDSHPYWSPDGRWLAFLSDRCTEVSERRAQIWLLPSDGGEATCLTESREAVERLAWSPDSSRIAFTARAPSEDGAVTDAGAPRPANAGPRIITGLKYKSNGDGFIYDRRRHIFVVDLDGRDVRQLTFGDFDDADPCWSPDGTTIAFASARHAGHELDTAADIFAVPMSGGEPRRLTATLGPTQTPVFSPDGSLIAYLGHDDPHAGGARNTGVWIVSFGGASSTRSGRDAPRCLTSTFDRTAAGETPPAWCGDAGVLFACADAGAVGLCLAHTAANPPAVLVQGRRAVSAWSVDGTGSRIAFTASTPTAPAELFLAGIESAGPAPAVSERRLTSLNDTWLAEVELSQPETLTARSTDGTVVHGWLLPPSGFDPSATYPVLLNIHGGPHAYYGWSFFDEFQVQAGAGYAVLAVNPRGSQSYGEAFAGACRHDWGGGDYADVISGFEQALANFDYLDGHRAGVLGGSYGGFMTSWIVGQTNRFKAAVSERAVNSLVSLFGTSDIGYWFEQFEIGGTPLTTPDFFIERSPLTYAGEVETPLLILHSENDLRCPIEQAEQFYVAVRLHGRADVAFVRFPDESHELSRSGKPSRRVERFCIILDWFDRYLQPEAPAARSSALAPALSSAGWQTIADHVGTNE